MKTYTGSRSMTLIATAVTLLLAMALVAGLVLRSPVTSSATSAASDSVAAQEWEGQSDRALSTVGDQSFEISLASYSPARTGWAGNTARFAGCLGGIGFVATPIVAGFMFGGPSGAVAAAKVWIPRLGPAGTGILRWCMQSVLGVRM